LSAITISSASVSDDDVSQCQDDSVICCTSAAVDENNDVNILDDQTKNNADKIAEKNSAADSYSRRMDRNEVGSLLPHSSDKEAVGAVLCLLHGLSHCSYHESSLLLLADHATYHPAVNLFTCLWHRLQSSQEHNDKTQACIYMFLYSLLYILIYVYKFLFNIFISI